jgi:hypothetical protein
LVLNRINGDTINIDLSAFTGGTGTDVFVTGGTYSSSASTITFTNNTGGTFTVTGVTSGGGSQYVNNIIPSGLTITVPQNQQYLVYGDLTLAGQLNNLGNVVIINGSLINSGGTFNNSGTTTFVSFPSGTGTDTFVTGGTYNQSNGIATFTNNTGGTFTVTGFTTGGTGTDVFVTGGTYNSSASTITFTNNTGGTFTVTGISGGTGTDYYTISAGLNGNTIEFDRTDTPNAYSVDLSPILSGFTGNTIYTQINNYVSGVSQTINHNFNSTDIHVQIIYKNQLIYGLVDNYQLNSVDVTLTSNLTGVKVIVIGSGGGGGSGTNSSIYYLSHDSTSPADNNSYYIGNLSQLGAVTSSGDDRRIISQYTGQVTEVSIGRIITGTIGSSENNTYQINNVTQATSALITSGETLDSSSSLNNYTLASPLAVNSGDKLEIEWQTPVYATNPTSVRQQFNLKIEY